LAEHPDNLFVEEFLDDFYAECDEHLAALRHTILALENAGESQSERSLIGDLLRSFHTLKGLAGMVGILPVEQLAHQTESYLRLLSQGQVAFEAEALNGLIASTRTIEQVLAVHRAREPLPDVGPVLARLASLLPAVQTTTLPSAPAAPPAQGAGPQPTLSPEERARVDHAIRTETPLWLVTFVPTPQLTERLINVSVIRERLKALGETIRAVPLVLGEGKIAFEFLLAGDFDHAILDSWQDDGVSSAPYLVDAPAEIVPASPQTLSPVAGSSLAPAHSVRVDIERIDEVMRVVGELVISRVRLKEQLEPLEPDVTISAWRTLQETVGVLERQLRRLRQGVMQMRMVPIGETFARMQFVIYDLARESGRQVVLELRGQETEIDKLIVERMLDPLLHLVRNAFSHGLEPTVERIAAGKPAAGQIALAAATVGDLVQIAVEDDGRGIDVEHVAQRARALGLLEDDQLLDPLMLLDILCAPGFSTREEADRISGRGVGMDVVKRVVQELGGQIMLDTRVGSGTRFTIHLPLTLVIADALMVAVSDQTYAVPMPVVREVIELSSALVTTLEESELVAYRGGALPLLQLDYRLGLPRRRVGAGQALVIGSGLGAAGIVIDRILEKREIVVRPLADPLLRIDGLAGATELGDGRPALILDAVALTRARVADDRRPPTDDRRTAEPRDHRTEGSGTNEQTSKRTKAQPQQQGQHETRNTHHEAQHTHHSRLATQSETRTADY
jgi:two-component system chemotaxis sensor kinase CheA